MCDISINLLSLLKSSTYTIQVCAWHTQIAIFKDLSFLYILPYRILAGHLRTYKTFWMLMWDISISLLSSLKSRIHDTSLCLTSTNYHFQRLVWLSTYWRGQLYVGDIGIPDPVSEYWVRGRDFESGTKFLKLLTLQGGEGDSFFGEIVLTCT